MRRHMIWQLQSGLRDAGRPSRGRAPASRRARRLLDQLGDEASARPQAPPPRDIATDLAKGLATDGLIARAEVAGPGFVNVWLDAGHVERSVDAIRAAGLDYGRTQTASPRASTSSSSAPTRPDR